MRLLSFALPFGLFESAIDFFAVRPMDVSKSRRTRSGIFMQILYKKKTLDVICCVFS